MKPRLSKALFTALLAAMAALPCALADGTLNLYILTGQSNSLGAVKGTPAPADLLQQYSSQGLLWNGNMMKDSGSLYDTPSWVTVQPQKPTLNGNNCMGPEYGFDYMMLRHGWGIQQAGDNVGVIKASLDGGGNGYWVKGTKAYNSIFNTVSAALTAAQAEGSGYTSVNLAGLIYLQGESDGTAEIPLAQERYLAFFNNLKTDLTAAGFDTSNFTQSVLGECATWNGSDGTGTKNGVTTTTVAEQKALADSSEDIGWVRTRDLTKIKSGDSMGVHYDGKSEITIGARYAYAMALQQGWDVGHTRGDNYEVSLNSADAWWDGTLTTETVAVWDVSSANVEDTLTGNLELRGIRVEDPFRSETVIKNASGANATLSLGGAGIEVWGGHDLKILTNVGTTSGQTWQAAGGSNVTLGSASASITLSGSHGITLQRTGGTGVANFTIHASQADARTWTVGDGVRLSLGGEAWSNQGISVEAGASATLAAAAGNTLSLASLTLGNGATLDLGGSASVNLAVGALVFGTDSALNMNLSTSTRYDKLILGEGGTLSGTANFNITVGSGVSASRKYILFENWTGGDNYTFTATGAEGATLSLVDGNLVFRLAATEGSDFSKNFPEGATAQTITAAGNYFAAANGDNTIVTKDSGVTGNVQFFASKFNTENGTTYAELNNSSVNWVCAFGSGSSGSMSTVTGSPSVKVTGSDTISVNAVYGGVNGSLTGDAYIELDADNATYGSINGAYNANIDGSLTFVVRGGTVKGNFTAGVVNGTKTISGGVKIQIDGGTFNGMVAGGNNAAGSQIQNGIDLVINGGTFKNYVIGAGFAGTVNGDVSLTISGGDFSAMNGSKGVYAGAGSTSTVFSGNTVVTLKDIDDTNSFATYTGVLSGKNQANLTFTGTSKLVLDNYTVTNMVHNLQGMDAVEVIGGSNTTVAQAKGLGGTSSVSIEDGSRLRLTSTSNWDFSAKTLTVDGEFVTSGTFALGAPTGAGSIIVESGTTSVDSLAGFTGTVQTLNSSVATVTTGNSAVTYDVGAKSTLNLGVSGGNQGTLTGAGRVVLTGENGTNTTAFTLDEAWTGTVVLTDSVVGKSGNNVIVNFNNYGQAGSTIELNGFGANTSNYSYIDADRTFDSSFVLNGNADGVGLFLNAGSSNATYAFTGAWTGDGDLSFSPATANVTATFHFKGDMTGYAGDYLVKCGATLMFGYGDTGAGTGSVSGTGSISGTGANTAHVVYNYTSNVSADNLITGNVDLKKMGYADLTLSGANTYTGTTTIADGTLVLSGQGSTGTGDVVINANAGLRTEKFGIANAAGATATLTVDSNGLKASSIGVESIALAGTGVHTITGNVQTNTLTNAGTLRLNNAGLSFWCVSGGKAYDLGSVDVKGASSITSIWANANVNISTLSSEGDAILTLCNNTSGTNTHTFNLGTAGKADSAAAFTGSINVEAGPAYKASGKVTTMDLVIKEENVAANAVINFLSSSARANNLNLKLDAATVNVAGITTDASLHEGEVPVITSVSGTKTLGLTGSGDYEAAVTLTNIAISKTGSGTQAFTGDASGAGDISVSGGTLAFVDAGTISGSAISISGEGQLVFGHKDADSVTLGAKGASPATVASTVSFGSSNGGIGGSGTIRQAKVVFTGTADQNVASTVKFQDCELSNSSTGDVTISGELKGDITVDTGTVTYNGTESVTVEEDKSFQVKAEAALAFSKGEGETQAVVTITAQDSETAANIGSGVTFNSDECAIAGTGKVSNAVLDFSGMVAQEVGTDISLNGCSIVNSGESLVSIKVNNGDSGYRLLHAKNSDITLLNATDLAVGEVKLAQGQALSAFTGTDAAATPATANEATLSLSKLTAEGNSTLNANLVFGNEAHDAYSLVMMGTVTMGSDVWLYSGGTLEVSEGAEIQVLFTSVDQLFINGVLITSDGEIFADKLFTNAADMSGIRWNQAPDATWMVTYYAHIPEPASTTLSLLALAALAARRRRH